MEMVRKIGAFVSVVAAGLMLGLLLISPMAHANDSVIRVALTNPIQTLDPANYRHRETETVIRNIFDGLYTQTPQGELVPEIAESIRQIDDLTWEFKIREGVRFHNGDPLTAEDVAFSFNRVVIEGAMEGSTSPRKGLMGSLERVEVVDDYTVHFHLSSPQSELRMLYTAAYMQIMPKRYFESVGVEEFIRNPVGAGPFKLVEAVYDERIVLERFDDYWGGAPALPGTPGPAPVKQAVFQVIREGATRVAALRAGDVDIIQHIPPDHLPVLRADPAVDVKTGPGTNIIYMVLNPAYAPVDNVNVRRAIAHAIDYELIVKYLFDGAADVLAGQPFSWNSEVKHPGLAQFDYNPDKARQLIAEAGATGAGLVIDTVDEFRVLSEAIAQLLRDVGLNAEVRLWESAAWQAAGQEGTRVAMLNRWGNGSGNPLFPEWPLAYTTWTDPEFVELMAQGPTIVDPEVREATFRRAYEIYYDDLPVITLVLPHTIDAALKSVVNFEAHPGGRVNLHRVDIAR